MVCTPILCTEPILSLSNGAISSPIHFTACSAVFCDMPCGAITLVDDIPMYDVSIIGLEEVLRGEI